MKKEHCDICDSILEPYNKLYKVKITKREELCDIFAGRVKLKICSSCVDVILDLSLKKQKENETKIHN